MSKCKANGREQQCFIGENAVIDDGVVLGYAAGRGKQQPLVIGADARIRTGTVIYGASRIGHHLETGHNVVIREDNVIGDHLNIWSNSIIDYDCRIGNGVKIHAGVYIAQFTVIEDGVFIGPGVSTANDVHPLCPDAVRCMQGPHIKRYAQIGVNACILPRVVIGEHAIIGAGSVVTGDIPPRMVAYGNPARTVCDIDELKCHTGRREKPYDDLFRRTGNADSIG